MVRTNINELAQQRFIATPKLLLYGEKYKDLSGNAFKTYVALYDRFTLSVKNNWIDEDNNVYFVYDLKDLEEITCIKESALRTARQQLKDVGLIEEVSTGRNNRIYLSLPIPKDEEEAKFIITEQDSDDLKDTSKMTEEEKHKIAENLKGNKNSQKTDDTGKSSIAVETAQQQQSTENGKQTILENQVSEPSKSSTNDTDLNEPDKDLKDNKESKGNYEYENDFFENGLNNLKDDHEENSKLIKQAIEENSLEALYGKYIVENMVKYSFGSFETFNLYINKLLIAHKQVEEEENFSFCLDLMFTPYYENYQKELSRTFYKVIQQQRQGKVKSFNNYLFISLKSSLSYMSKQIKEDRAERNTPSDSEFDDVVNYKYE